MMGAVTPDNLERMTGDRRLNGWLRAARASLGQMVLYDLVA